CLTSDSGNDGLFTTSAYTCIVLPKSSLRQFACQNQLLLPQPVFRSPPIESKNSAICCALRVVVPRGSVSIARLPRPLVLASSAVSPPRLYMLIVISGVVA